MHQVTRWQAEASTLEAEARDLNSKADAIESAVYDLKAVNIIGIPLAIIAVVVPIVL
jgi:hypothetical protein